MGQKANVTKQKWSKYKMQIGQYDSYASMQNEFITSWATSMSQPDLSLKKVTTKILQINCLRNG